MMEKITVQIGDLVTFQRGHDLPKINMIKGSVPVVGSNSIIGYHNVSTTKGPGVTVGRSGNIGNPQYIKSDYWAHNTVLYVKAFKEVDPLYFYYLLKSLDFKNLNSGSAVPSLNRNILHPLKVSVYKSLEKQKEVADILSSLDDKIELNNKINQELENLAQTIFKRWFIDFEFPDENGNPYKSSGGEFKVKSGGKLPIYWNKYDLCQLVESVSIRYPLKSSEKVIFLNTGDILNGKFLHHNTSEPSSLPGQAKKSIMADDILYSEIRPANKRFAFVNFDSSNYVVSTKLMVLRSKTSAHNLFNYFLLSLQSTIDKLQTLAESRSGTFPQITYNELSKVSFYLPNQGLIGEFTESILKPFFEQRFQLENENEILIKTRELLIKKLFDTK